MRLDDRLLSCVVAIASGLAPALARAQPDSAAGGAPATPLAGCAGCHGAAGEGRADVGAPRLAGQGLAYLRAQLDAYADGRRRNAVMTPIAKGLSPQQRHAAASLYARTTAPSAATTTPAPKAAARGALLSARGDEAIGVQACANCHGPDGVGLPGQVPYLAGQQAGYIAASLAAWRDGSRRTDPSGQMPHIARALRPDDVQSLAAWFASRAAPQALDAQRRAEWRSSGRAITSGPTPAARSDASPGESAEQGTPTTDGGVGPGGGGAGRPGGSGDGASGASR